MEILFLIPWLVVVVFIIVGVIVSTSLFRRIRERNQAHKVLDTDLFGGEKRERG